MSFSKFEEFSAIKSLNSLAAPFSLSLSPSGTPTVHTLVHFMVSTGPLGSVYFSSIFFCSSASIIFIVLSYSSLFLSSSCPNLPLNVSEEYFISIIVLFSSGISFWFPFTFSVSLPILPFYSHIICVNSNSYFFHLGHAPMLFPFFGVDQML